MPRIYFFPVAFTGDGRENSHKSFQSDEQDTFFLGSYNREGSTLSSVSGKSAVASDLLGILIYTLTPLTESKTDIFFFSWWNVEKEKRSHVMISPRANSRRWWHLGVRKQNTEISLEVQFPPLKPLPIFLPTQVSPRDGLSQLFLFFNFLILISGKRCQGEYLAFNGRRFSCFLSSQRAG